MHRSLLLASAANGFLGVALGAFGAHGLKSHLEGVVDVARRLAWWDTASHYHLVHALALGLLALASERLPAAWVRWAALAMISGIVGFSGSLYAMALSGVTGLGAVTPIGGVGLLLGWLLLGIGVVRAEPYGAVRRAP